MSLLIDLAEIQEGDGPAAVMVEKNANCQECGKVHDIEACPKCGSWIALGYGLAFGGMGEYKYCANEQCDWFYKEEEPT